jgi:C1A family cysteine protease
MKYTYNYKKDKPDERDVKFKSHHAKLYTLPPVFDLSQIPSFPSVLNQQQLGSCTANASSNALRYCLKKFNSNVFQPSRLYIYYFSRLLENNINEDSGASIRVVMKAISKYGTCDEVVWPYDLVKFTTKPPPRCCSNGLSHTKTFAYSSVIQDEKSIKSCIYSGFPIICGIQVYSSLESDKTMKTGNVDLPSPVDTLEGGHCILLVGYNDTTKMFKFQNSWGDKVGDRGYFNIPYAYITDTNLASDFWVIQMFK